MLFVFSTLQRGKMLEELEARRWHWNIVCLYATYNQNQLLTRRLLSTTLFSTLSSLYHLQRAQWIFPLVRPYECVKMTKVLETNSKYLTNRGWNELEKSSLLCRSNSYRSFPNKYVCSTRAVNWMDILTKAPVAATREPAFYCLSWIRMKKIHRRSLYSEPLARM